MPKHGYKDVIKETAQDTAVKLKFEAVWGNPRVDYISFFFHCFSTTTICDASPYKYTCSKNIITITIFLQH